MSMTTKREDAYGRVPSPPRTGPGVGVVGGASSPSALGRGPRRNNRRSEESEECCHSIRSHASARCRFESRLVWAPDETVLGNGKRLLNSQENSSSHVDFYLPRPPKVLFRE